MIKFFESNSLDLLETMVNEYVVRLPHDALIHDLQYRMTDGEYGQYYSVCIRYSIPIIKCH